MSSDPFASIVIPVYNEEDTLRPLFARLTKVLDDLNKSSEIIFINDGSRDRSIEMLRDFLEVRGLGILNIRAMFGASAIKQHRNLRLIIVLQQLENATQVDRLHGSRQMRKIQEVDIPEITLPVGPGRNLAVLLEAAVRNHILNAKGYDASQAFIDRQKRRLENVHQ